MVNPGIVLLAIVVVIIFIVMAVGLSVAIAADIANQGKTGNTGGVLEPCSQMVDYDKLITIPAGMTACLQECHDIGLYYIGNLPPFTYDYVVAPYPSSPLDVCIHFCTSFTGTVCTGPDYAGQTAQVNFDNCLAQLSSDTCIPPFPIAIKGTTLYYAIMPTNHSCGCDG